MPGLRPFTGSGPDDSDDLTSPEALLISAFLSQGVFNPEKHHVTSDDIDGWGKLWEFCHDYQAKAGTTPPPGLVSSMFPEFTPTADVDVSWAAAKVRNAAALRNLRHRSRQMLMAVNDEDVDGAFSAMEGLQRPRGHRKDPVSVFDHSVLAEDFEVSKIEVPFPTLQRASKGGIAPSEYWVLAARLGTGKTHIGLEFMARAAMAGVHCAIASYEMPSKQVNQRLIRKMAGRDASLLRMLDSEDEMERKKGMDATRERVPGDVHVYDPSHGQINTTTFVRELSGDYEFVMLDHLGLMQNAEGKRAIDDWRVQAWISNVVRETTLASSTPILALAQVNRTAESSPNSTRAPKASELSQSDAIGQDADAVITMKRLSKRVTRYEAVKLREGPNASWYSRFEPERNRFDEISKESADELRIVDTSEEDF
jgi:hypothetical protein